MHRRIPCPVFFAVLLAGGSLLSGCAAPAERSAATGVPRQGDARPQPADAEVRFPGVDSASDLPAERPARESDPAVEQDPFPELVALDLPPQVSAEPVRVERSTAAGSSAKPAEPAAPASEAPSTRPLSGKPPGTFDNLHAIEPGRAYRSAQLSGETLRYVIQANGIQTVVNLRGENQQDEWYRDELAVCRELGVKHVDIRLSASELPSRENLLLMFETFQQAAAASQPVLMHCKSGSDRTGMAAAVWRMTVLGEPAAKAREQLHLKYGHFIAAHPEMRQLVDQFKPERVWIEQEYQR